MDAIGLKQTPETGTRFTFDMTAPPVRRETEGAVLLGIYGNVIGDFEDNGSVGRSGDTRKATAGCLFLEFET